MLNEIDPHKSRSTVTKTLIDATTPIGHNNTLSYITIAKFFVLFCTGNHYIHFTVFADPLPSAERTQETNKPGFYPADSIYYLTGPNSIVFGCDGVVLCKSGGPTGHLIGTYIRAPEESNKQAPIQWQSYHISGGGEYSIDHRVRTYRLGQRRYPFCQ